MYSDNYINKKKYQVIEVNFFNKIYLYEQFLSNNVEFVFILLYFEGLLW